ncbi:MAG: T9SS type A sorting domain-containing protein [Bacteroidia bacterium]
MKIYIYVAFILFAINVKAQITLDNIVYPKCGIGTDFFTVQISKTETKYLFEDTTTNTFSLYNMDFTPFMTNIAVPRPFAHWTYQVLYVTRSLFDCDSTNIEYVYQSTLISTGTFYIMRTDGTQLFRLDSASGPYSYGGSLGGSDIIQPIRSTSAGTKMFLQGITTSSKIYIYSLCGTYKNNIFDYRNANQSVVKIFPNPTSGTLTFQINPPDNMNDYELVIFDTNAKELRRERINSGNNKYVIDVSNFSSGAYYYSLSTKDKTAKSGKFILTK